MNRSLNASSNRSLSLSQTPPPPLSSVFVVVGLAIPTARVVVGGFVVVRRRRPTRAT
jgi:hypothetical protein